MDTSAPAHTAFRFRYFHLFPLASNKAIHLCNYHSFPTTTHTIYDNHPSFGPHIGRVNTLHTQTTGSTRTARSESAAGEHIDTKQHT